MEAAGPEFLFSRPPQSCHQIQRDHHDPAIPGVVGPARSFRDRRCDGQSETNLATLRRSVETFPPLLRSVANRIALATPARFWRRFDAFRLLLLGETGL